MPAMPVLPAKPPAAPRSASRHRLAVTLACALLIPGLVPAASADAVPFGGGWQEQTFGLFGGGNDFAFRGAALDVVSDGTVSLVWDTLPEPLWRSGRASWRWQVDAGVPATDLTRKGGDDRNLAIYFVFLPAEDAAAVRQAGIRSLLGNPEVRVLTYVWGGAHARGAVLPSPYLGNRGRTIVLRGAGTGAAQEQVNLAADYTRAFGGRPQSVVGVAVSADSDDTDSIIRARVADLRIE